MTDVTSLLHRGFYLNPALFDPIDIGRFRLSIQASSSHHCSPRQDLHPYQYDEMEIAIYAPKKNVATWVIKKMLHHKWESWGNFYSYVTTKELQWICVLFTTSRMYPFCHSAKSDHSLWARLVFMQALERKYSLIV